ncbi:YbhB/YbcL family Raf kinase inhibitor-like protein [Variovorax ginsengisoli]|uniref:Raf kinase inhibitor-like YbhB/YbcL family protein n=1 Tax=Variovorax ginsengisoli TaxID=363844 RepID=A0ABT9SER4_9BURK|nr:YbhB/YbcL family Raf kinase inhibitor-like protein [Variovorax ginsengisoli]MDP9902850.1 Raf kinase inhibitor-like YbhB/YbcL family protein [Variovorax ginsengisoli]
MKKIGCVAGVALAMLVSACAMKPASEGAGPSPSARKPFELTSPQFADGTDLALKNAGNAKENPNCVGQNVSPPLDWKNMPSGTRSFALTVFDHEGRSGLGVVHWVAYGIPASVTGFSENEVSVPSPKFVGGRGTSGSGSYAGPCPPAGTGKHHYIFTLIATDLEPGTLPAGLTQAQLLEKLDGRVKGATSLVGLFGQP